MGWLRAHWKAVAIGTVVFFIGVGIGASGSETTSEGAGETETITETTTVTEGSEAETETVTETVEAESQPGATIPGDGIFLVGEDIRPGTYRTPGGSGCYWARLSGTSGELEDIIANGNVTGPTTITIAPSDDAFQTSDCEEWQRR